MTWQLAVFAAAFVVAVVVIAWEVGRKWADIVSALYPGRAPAPREPVDVDRWRRVHIDADQRRPFAINSERVR